MKNNTLKNTQKFLGSLGLPEGDCYANCPLGLAWFSDGGQYRFEVPGIQSPSVMKALLVELDRLEIIIHRVTQTKGIMSLTDDEIRSMVELSHEHMELVLAIGPRATTDTSASVNTPEGQRCTSRIEELDQIVRAIEDVKRASLLGWHTWFMMKGVYGF